MDKEVYNGQLRKKKVEHIRAQIYICKSGALKWDTLGHKDTFVKEVQIGAQIYICKSGAHWEIL